MKEVKKANAFEAFEIIDLEEKLEFCILSDAGCSCNGVCGNNGGCGCSANVGCGCQAVCGGAGCTE